MDQSANTAKKLFITSPVESKGLSQFRKLVQNNKDYLRLNETWAVRARPRINDQTEKPMKAGHCFLELFEIAKSRIVPGTDVELSELPAVAATKPAVIIELNNFIVSGLSASNLLTVEQVFMKAIRLLYENDVYTSTNFDFHGHIGNKGHSLFQRRFELQLHPAQHVTIVKGLLGNKKKPALFTATSIAKRRKTAVSCDSSGDSTDTCAESSCAVRAHSPFTPQAKDPTSAVSGMIAKLPATVPTKPVIKKSSAISSG